MVNRLQKIFCLMAFMAICTAAMLPPQAIKIGLLKYNGGGDWYANPTALPNLIAFCNKEMGMNIDPEPVTVEVGSPDIFNLPLLHMTGHGNVVFSTEEAENLRLYLEAGGFLHIDDNYGMDPYVRTAIAEVFPDNAFVEVPFSHPIYDQQYQFPRGVPKIHEHDGKPAQAFGIFIEERLAVFYTYETDLGDGWEDTEVHNDTPQNRRKSLQMGANLLRFALVQ